MKEKEIEIEFNEQKIKSNISNEILDKLSNSMMESIFNIILSNCSTSISQ